jgi:two-component system nitrogen regulation sensor histidine kinase GlnL
MILAGLLAGVIAFDGKGRVSYVNAAAESMLGRSRRDVFGISREALFEEDPWLLKLFDRVESSAETSVRDEGSLAGSGIPLATAVVSRLHDSHGATEGTILVLHDVGRRHWMHGDAQEKSRLEELDRMIASIGHELNNPLAGIRAAAQLLQKKLSDYGDLAEYGSMIVRQADRMADLIRVLMSLEAPIPAMEPVNIHKVLDEVLMLEKTRLDERGIDIRRSYDPSLPEVLGNEDQLEQLFLNIVKNAMRACPAQDGTIAIETRMETSYYVETENRKLRYISVEIIDNGPGLDDEVTAHLFTPFFSRAQGGHGLGLSIARNIAISHNGRIQAANARNAGASFRVSLPVAESGPTVNGG